MAWPKGRKNPALAQAMREYHAARKQSRPEPAPKPSRALPPLTPEEKREYEKLRRYGIDRSAALASILGAPH